MDYPVSGLLTLRHDAPREILAGLSVSYFEQANDYSRGRRLAYAGFMDRPGSEVSEVTGRLYDTRTPHLLLLHATAANPAEESVYSGRGFPCRMTLMGGQYVAFITEAPDFTSPPAVNIRQYMRFCQARNAFYRQCAVATPEPTPP